MKTLTAYFVPVALGVAYVLIMYAYVFQVVLHHG